MMNLSYCAGFIDGEGWIGIAKVNANRKHPGYSIIMGISNTNLEILENIYKFLGCKGTIRSKGRIRGNRKPSYELRIHGNSCRDILKNLTGLLQVKKEQAQLCLSLPTLPKINTGKVRDAILRLKPVQENIYLQCKALNAKGIL